MSNYKDAAKAYNKLQTKCVEELTDEDIKQLFEQRVSKREISKMLYCCGRIKRQKKHSPITFYVPDVLGDKIEELAEGPIAGRLAALAWIGLENIEKENKKIEFNLDFFNPKNKGEKKK